ncbi:MAG: hypothetical protein HC888_06435 [Candidatus Competibacteraceae bacterium]|nr:hypothetical protein [Candidatus Competibacteraceae bacterium]
MTKALPKVTGGVTCASCRDTGAILDVSTNPPKYVGCPDCDAGKAVGAPAPKATGAVAPKSDLKGFDKLESVVDEGFSFLETLFGTKKDGSE